MPFMERFRGQLLRTQRGAPWAVLGLCVPGRLDCELPADGDDYPLTPLPCARPEPGKDGQG